MRPFKFFFVLALCLLLLAGCGRTEVPTPAPDPPTPAPDFHTEAPPAEEEPLDPQDLEIEIPEEYRDIAEAIGLEAFTQLTLLCGGQSLYIPKRESLERGARDRDIRARFDGGNYRALAVQFRLSERQIRKIINGSRS